MNKERFISKKTGLIITRLNPEQYFKKKINSIKEYHRDLGIMHGQLLQEELQEMETYLPKFLIKTRGKIMGKLAYRILFWAAKQTKKYIRSEYLIEMEGVAKGAKVNPNFILLINVFDELKNLYGCSALAVEEDGRMLYGANTDYAIFGDILGHTNTVFIYQRSFGLNFMTAGWPGHIGLIRGMNDQGLVLISLASYSTDQTIKGIPTPFLYRKVIESNKLHLLNTAPRTIGNNILIGNKEKVKLVEVSAKDLGIRMPWRIKGKKYITTTNYYQTAMEKYQRDPVLPPGSTIPLNKVEEWFWEFFGLGGSKKRKTILEQEIKTSKEFEPETIKNILARVASPYTTLNCMVFDPANLEFYMADNNGKMPATDGKLVKINVGNLFKL